MKNTVDLNLYRFLCVLHDKRSQPKTSHTLNISRATFNRYLSECRDMFNDELFIAQNGRYAPTQLGSQLIDSIKTPLSILEESGKLSQQVAFDNQNITFATPSILADYLTLPLVEALTTNDHPQTIHFIDWSADIVEHPPKNTLVIGIRGYPSKVSESVVERYLGDIPLYVYLPATHALADQAVVSIKEIHHEKSVRISMGALDNNEYYLAFSRETGITLNQQLTVATTACALDCVALGHYFCINADIPQQKLPPNVVKRPVFLDQQAMRYSVGMQFHRAWYQHPAIKFLDKLLSQVINP